MAVGAPQVGTIYGRAAESASLVPYPTIVNAGDLLLFTGSVGSTVAITPPAGWTEVRDFQTTGGLPRLWVAVKYAAGTEGGTTETINHSNNPSCWQILAFPGVDQTTYNDVTETIYDASTADVILPSLTTTRPGVALVAIATNSVASSTGTAPTSPGTFTEDGDLGSGTRTLWVGHLLWSGSGATGTVTVPLTNSGRAAGVLLALRPAAEVISAYAQPRRSRGTPARRAKPSWSVTQVVVPSQPVPPVTAARSRRGPGVPRRRGRAVGPVPVQTVPAPPVFVTQDVQARRVRGWWARRRQTQALPVQPDMSAVAPRPRRIRGLLSRRGRPVNLVPPQFNPPLVPVVAAAPKRRGLFARRTRPVTPVLTQAGPVAPAYPPAAHAAPRRLRGLLGRRGRALFTIPDQAAPVPPAFVPQPSRPRRLRGILTRPRRPAPHLQTAAGAFPQTLPRRVRAVVQRRGHLAQPAPAQAAPTPPAFVPQPGTHRIRALPVRRGTTVDPALPQAEAPPHLRPLQRNQPRRVRGLLPRRGKTPAAPLVQAVPPAQFVPQAAQRRTVRGMATRRRPSKPLPAAQGMPVPFTRGRVRLAFRPRRGLWLPPLPIIIITGPGRGTYDLHPASTADRAAYGPAGRTVSGTADHASQPPGEVNSR